MSNTLYDQDFFAWATEQARLLRAGRVSEADIGHIAEEIESMGRSEKRELVNRLSVLLMHLLKGRFQPSARGTNWRLTIEEQRHRLADHLLDNPSLKATLDASIASGYRLAVLGAARETGLDRAVFPPACPWPFEQVMDPDFWPEHG
jgi:hypothetical protein